MMTFPTEWENKSHVPNHPPVPYMEHPGLGQLTDIPLGLPTTWNASATCPPAAAVIQLGLLGGVPEMGGTPKWENHRKTIGKP